MTFPFITCITAGLLLLLQIILAMTVSINRGRLKAPIGDGGNTAMLRLTRRHANFAENAGIFVGGFTLLELSHFYPTLLISLCSIFVIARLLHAFGLSMENTENPLRVLGAMGTYITGLVLGGTLVWIGWRMIMAAHNSGAVR